MNILEEEFLKIFKNYHLSVYSDDFPNTISYKNSRKKWLMEYLPKKGEVWISYTRISLNLKKQVTMSEYDINIFIKKMLYKYFKIDNVNVFTEQVFEEDSRLWG